MTSESDAGGRNGNLAGRSSAIEAVKTPLGFYALVVLVAEGILSVAVGLTDGLDRTVLVLGMTGSLISLIFLVAGISIWRPRALYGEVSTVVNVKLRSLEANGIEETGGDLADEFELTRTIRDPRILVADALFGISGGDARNIGSVWPAAAVTNLEPAHANALASTLLTHGSFDILQLTANVSSSGNIQFEDREISPGELVELAKHSNIGLVVLASCNSATMAAEVAPHLNMIAATEQLEVDEWSRWSTVFYTLLANGLPLSQAYAITRAVVKAPVVMILREDFIVRPGLH